MRYYGIFLFASLFAIISLTSCEISEPNVILLDSVKSEYPEVDQRLWSYLDRFIEESSKRGIDNLQGDLAILSGEFLNIQDQGVAGTCNYSSHNPNRITIDLPIWNNSSDLARELVVFHELGHCILLRDHLDACNANQIYTSMMRSGLGNCIDGYNQQNRDYYLDELFSIYGDWFE